MKELLKQEMKRHNRDAVVNLLKDGAFEQIVEEEMMQMCAELIALRDKEIVAVLAKKIDKFEPEMLKLDLDNWNNREFVNYILDKYNKKIDWNDEMVCDEMFEIACKADNVKTVRFLIKQRRAFSKYDQMGSASDAIFRLITLVNPNELENEQIVNLIVQTAISGKEEERLHILRERGFELKTKNGKEQTAADVLEERIQNAKYAKNKSGELQKKKEKNALQYLIKVQNGFVKKEEDPLPKKKVVIGIAVAIVALAVVIGVLVAPKTTGTEYSTDTNLVVEDGDTVNIDYVGYINGIEFNGGNTNGQGTKLTIGSGAYIDDFEEQLIGANVGDTVDVYVTFPENYGNENLNGKDALFEVVINGIYK